MPTWRGLRDPSGRTTRSPPVSGRMVQEAPAGTEPTGSPLPSSVTNSSPSPPSVTLAAPSARTLARTCLAQGRVELCDGEIDIRIRVRAGDEACLEGRGREEHTPGERRAVPAREQARVRALRLGERAHRPRGEMDAPHRAGVTPGRRDSSPAR